MKKEDETQKVVAEETVTEAPDMNELIEIRINRDNKEQGDVVASVNGKVFRIKRGEKVKVPRYIVEVLENTRKMDELRIERMQEATKNF